MPHDYLRVATLNIAHGRGASRRRIGKPRSTFKSNLDGIANAVISQRPHVLALQEADAVSRLSGAFHHVDYLQRAVGYDHCLHGRHFKLGNRRPTLDYGTALLSDLPLSNTYSHSFKEEWIDTKGFVSARINFANCAITIVSVHLDFKSSRTRKLQVRRLLATLSKNAGPFIIMGDLNSVWTRDDALRLLVNELDLVAYEPHSQHIRTFRSTRPKRRLDWILVSPTLEFADHRIWCDQVSDHLAVSATLKLRQA